MIKVLDKGFVELQDIMGSDLTIVNAARVSFLGESKGAEKDKKLLNYLWKNKHMSPFEMVELKFRIKAPLFVVTHFLRHRTASFNVQSSRYTITKEEDFYVPNYDEWRKQSESNKQGSSNENIPINDGRWFTDTLERNIELSYTFYKTAISKGIAKEQARLFLPANAQYATFIFKIDLRNLLHFLKLRMSEDAQYETRQYANAIAKFVEEKLPWTWEVFNE